MSTDPSFRSVARLLYRLRGAARPISLAKIGRRGEYLDVTGWFESARLHASVDTGGRPIAWFTYPAISFLEARLKPDLTVFEYGSGNSTLWWAERCQHVTSCEHSREWVEKLRPDLPLNANLIFEPLSGEGGCYPEMPLRENEKYDIIVIDGRERNACAHIAPAALSTQGCIILDNSDRDKYKSGVAALLQGGFKQLPFTGLSPIVSNMNCTSIFYRKGNCLDI